MIEHTAKFSQATAGGYTWSSGQEPSNYGRSMVHAAVLGAGGLGVYGALTSEMKGGQRAIDYLAASTKFIGNMSPFQILNTFRAPEIMTPFQSAKGMFGAESAVKEFKFESQFLNNEGTYWWIKNQTGRSQAELEAAGYFRPNISREGKDVAESMVFRAHPDRPGGALYSVFKGGKETLLSEHMSLAKLTAENTGIDTLLASKSGINPHAEGLLAGEDFFSRELNSVDEFLVADGKRLGFMPVASSNGPLQTLGDLRRRTSGVRGVWAMEMMRFNRLLTGVTETSLGEGGLKILKALGVDKELRPGPASHMFLRFGGRAATVGAVGLGIAQGDWFRREGGLAGHIGVSAVTSAALTWGVSKVATNPRTAIFAGLASFAGQIFLPGFDKGIVAGAATTATKLDIARANVLNPFNYVRRIEEGFMPGVTDATTGVLFGIGVVGAAAVKNPFTGKKFAHSLYDWFGDKLGVRSGLGVERALYSTRDVFWQEVGGMSPSTSQMGLGHGTALDRYRAFRELGAQATSKLGFTQKLNSLWERAEANQKGYRPLNDVGLALVEDLKGIASKYSTNSITDIAGREFHGFVSQVKHSLFGADAQTFKSTIKALGFSKHGPVGSLGRYGTLGVAAFALHGLVTGGFLGSKETSDDLRKIYSGQKLVNVRQGRYWEAGGREFEGGDITYQRPHWYSLMMNRVRESGVWGENEDDFSPIGKFFRKNFTYSLEKSRYWERPYPISSAAFEDIPIVGGILASTVGRLIKPPRLMHTGEWSRDGASGPEFGYPYKGDRFEPAYGLGAEGQGAPRSPYELSYRLTDISNQFRELEGMTGWLKNTIQDVATGEINTYGTQPVLATAGRMTSLRRRFWEADLGGMAFSNEFLRRILPHEQHQAPLYNPIMNSMPSWLPQKLKYGDPYENVQWGEARLPGAGYAALHPELKGVPGEAYPLVYKYSILSDVAGSSREYLAMKKQVYQTRRAGKFTRREEEYIDEVDRMYAEKSVGFEPNKTHPRAIRLPGSDATQAITGGLQNVLRTIVAPVEYMTPMGFRPIQKLLGDRRPIEQYEFERLYGTPNAFWDKPWRDWFRPGMYSAMHALGFSEKPLWRMQADRANEYFDKLEFFKWSALAQQAEGAGDGQSAESYRRRASETRTGVNPAGNPLAIYWSLPEQERKFFNAFSNAPSNERSRILDMIPSDEQALYKSVWARKDAGDESLWAGGETGYDQEYMDSQIAPAQSYFANRSLPDADWIGWHEDVDMRDIKTRYVQDQGKELYDYGLFNIDVSKANRQPFLYDAAREMNGVEFNSVQTRSDIFRTLGSVNQQPYVSMHAGNFSGSTAKVVYNDNRDVDIARAVRRGQ